MAVPSPPTQPVFSLVGPYQTNFSFSDGSTGGSTITARQLGYGLSSASPTNIINVGNSGVLDELRSGTRYYAWARTGNSNGWSGWSTRATFLTDPAKPYPPSTPVIGTITGTSVRLSFNDGHDGGSDITNRQVGYSKGSVAPTFIANVVSPVTIGALSEDTGWYFWARTQNRYGTSAWSGRAYAKTYGRPGAASVVRLTNMMQTSVDASFTPSTDTGGQPILEHQIGYDLSSAEPTKFITSDGSTTITGLIPGRVYFFQARSRNSVGWGPWGPQSSVRLRSGAFVNSGGAARESVPYVNVNGVWRNAVPWVRVSGVWMQI